MGAGILRLIPFESDDKYRRRVCQTAEKSLGTACLDIEPVSKYSEHFSAGKRHRPNSV